MLMGAHTSPPFFKEKRKKLACLKQVLRIYQLNRNFNTTWNVFFYAFSLAVAEKYYKSTANFI